MRKASRLAGWIPGALLLAGAFAAGYLVALGGAAPAGPGTDAVRHATEDTSPGGSEPVRVEPVDAGPSLESAGARELERLTAQGYVSRQGGSGYYRTVPGAEDGRVTVDALPTGTYAIRWGSNVETFAVPGPATVTLPQTPR